MPWEISVSFPDHVRRNFLFHSRKNLILTCLKKFHYNKIGWICSSCFTAKIAVKKTYCLLYIYYSKGNVHVFFCTSADAIRRVGTFERAIGSERCANSSNHHRSPVVPVWLSKREQRSIATLRVLENVFPLTFPISNKFNSILLSKYFQWIF